MANGFKTVAVLSWLAVSVAACQSIDTARIKNLKESEHTTKNATIYCAGTENCEFERLGTIRIIDPNTHRLQKAAVKKGIVRLQTQSLKEPNPIYLSVAPAQYELVIRFYPISPDKAETLHLIHNFSAKQNYSLKMFRDRSNGRGSLLSVSAPEPLCVDLQQNFKTIRRFCKPYNVLNGLGEFVEQKKFKSR